MVDTREAMESQYISVELIDKSKSKKGVVVAPG